MLENVTFINKTSDQGKDQSRVRIQAKDLRYRETPYANALVRLASEQLSELISQEAQRLDLSEVEISALIERLQKIAERSMI